MRYQMMKKKLIFNNGESKIVYSVGYVSKFLFWKFFTPCRDIRTLKEAKGILKILKERRGVRSKEYSEIERSVS